MYVFAFNQSFGGIFGGVWLNRISSIFVCLVLLYSNHCTHNAGWICQSVFLQQGIDWWLRHGAICHQDCAQEECEEEWRGRNWRAKGELPNSTHIYVYIWRRFLFRTCTFPHMHVHTKVIWADRFTCVVSSHTNNDDPHIHTCIPFIALSMHTCTINLPLHSI
jgi:hypothetical protein